LYNSSSNFKSLLQGVETATQNKTFPPVAGAAFAARGALSGVEANALFSTTPRAAAAPTAPKKVLRVVFMDFPLMEAGESLSQRNGILKGLVCGADGLVIFGMLAKAVADVVGAVVAAANARRYDACASAVSSRLKRANRRSGHA
jgi:hypothetical protein